MHLSAIRLRGFKSFPEAVEVRLEPGVAVVVGPNGSGKSNIADAIVWAAGSQSPSELRADRADDVLFAGAPGRAAAAWCEVELLFDNEDGQLADLPYSEVSIVRRLHRGGEGQYLVNRQPVRRLDLVELLADVGLAGGMHSVIGQGRVEAVLSSRPEERRALVEEAAGLGRFKRRRHRAELKLARVRVETGRARDLEAEVKSRLRPLALQATASERAERLGREIAALTARLVELGLADVHERRVAGEERLAAARLARRRTDERLEGVLRERSTAEEELADAAGAREAATASLYRLRSMRERLELRAESAAALHERLRVALPEDEVENVPAGPDPAELERAARDTERAARASAAARDSLTERLRVTRERAGALARSLAEREGLPPAARALAEEGERLALSLIDVEPGYERAVAAALRWRAAALVAPDAAAALRLLERARTGGLGNLTVLLRGAEGGAVTGSLGERARARPGGEPVAALLAGVRVVEDDELIEAGRSGPAVTREGLCCDGPAAELWFAGETAEAVLLEQEARRRALAEEERDLELQLEEERRRSAGLEGEAQAAARAWAAVADEIRRPRVDPEVVRRLASGAEALRVRLEEVQEAAHRFEAPLRARVDAGGARVGQLGGELRRLGGVEAELRREAGEAAERAGALEVELARLDAEESELRSRLEAVAVEPAQGADREELEAKRERLRRRRESLGQVNPLAGEEYARERERLGELTAQREDLERSLDELERLGAELADTVARRFEETFERVRETFEEVAATLFPGGGGRLLLQEVEEEDAEPGVEVELRPAGKRVTRLSLLSGGEKALGAIAFLFALFLARPCPFYLLDEVEAALDDANIARFVELLRGYADRAQFIVVTHQKRTMEAADTLYGVTMGADGVSQILSRRLPREEVVLSAAT